MTGLLCIMQLDIVIMKLREGKVIVSAAVIIGIYVAVFLSTCILRRYEHPGSMMR